MSPASYIDPRPAIVNPEPLARLREPQLAEGRGSVHGEPPLGAAHRRCRQVAHPARAGQESNRHWLGVVDRVVLEGDRDDPRRHTQPQMERRFAGGDGGDESKGGAARVPCRHNRVQAASPVTPDPQVVPLVSLEPPRQYPHYRKRHHADVRQDLVRVELARPDPPCNLRTLRGHRGGLQVVLRRRLHRRRHPGRPRPHHRPSCRQHRRRHLAPVNSVGIANRNRPWPLWPHPRCYVSQRRVERRVVPGHQGRATGAHPRRRPKLGLHLGVSLFPLFPAPLPCPPPA